MAVNDIYQAVLNLDMNNMADLVGREVDQGADLSVILREGLISALDEVGDRFQNGKLFIPEMLRAAKTAQIGLDVLKPLLTDTDARPAGRVLIGTVKGDMHDIGKNLVGMMLEGGGFEVIDLGVDVPVDKFMAAADEHRPDILALSALLTTTMPAMRDTVAEFRNAGTEMKIMVGGAPVNEDFCVKIGADGYAGGAPQAVRLARSMLTA